MQVTWTNPYYGVQHVKNIPRSHQITVTQYKTMATVKMLHLHGLSPFTSQKEESGDLADMMIAKGEAWAKELIGRA